MIQELLFSLLGFTGDIVVEADQTFKVRDGYDLLKEAEKEQINMIAPLGHYYVSFQNYTKKYAIAWGSHSIKNKIECYKAALCHAIEDLLTEYVESITFLENLTFAEENVIPLSLLVQHVQKVSASKLL